MPSWRDEYATGVALIDAQHQRLLGLVDELEAIERDDPTVEKLRAALDEVVAFTQVHFTMEEDLMVRVEYPESDQIEMIKQHRDFTGYIRIRVIEFREAPTEDVMPLRTFIAGWLVTHEFGLDNKLAAFIRVTDRER